MMRVCVNSGRLNAVARKAVLVWILAAAATSAAHDPSQAGRPDVQASNAAAQPEVQSTQPARPPGSDAAPASEAERLTRLQRAIDEASELIDHARRQLSDPESEYAKAEKEFQEIDRQRESTRNGGRVGGDASSSQPTDLSNEDLAAIEKKWRLAKDRFELAIKERKALKEQIETLETKLQGDREALRRLKGEDQATTTQPASDSGKPVPTENGKNQTPVGNQTQTESAPPANAAGTTASDAAASTPTPPAALPGVGSPVTPPAAAADSSKPKQGAKPGVVVPTKEILEARQTAAIKESQAKEAQEQAQTISQRMEALRKSIELEEKLYSNNRQRAENARRAEQNAYDELQEKWSAGAPAEKLGELRKVIQEARQRVASSEQESLARVERLEKLRGELSGLQAEHIAALETARETHGEAESAKRRVEQLESPFSPRNLWRWLVERGPRVAGILIGMFVLLWLSRRMEGRLVGLLAARSEHGTTEDSENRARTLVAVFRNAASIVLIVGAVLMVLSELGVNIVPLMGGAAVLGLAVAFGAQNLIRDFFSGFMILLENQYTINDVVKIGDAAGQVERITLRLTVLRGLDGTVHFVPNGEITRVSNMTHGWSRAVFDIPVAYKEDVGRVMDILMEEAKGLRRDPDYRGLILEMPEMLGVDEFADSAVVIKFLIKTRPLKQWTVKREMLRRIKDRFDALRIEIPFPHRTLYHRHDPEVSPLEGDGAPSSHSEAIR